MSTLLIRFDDASLNQFSWIIEGSGDSDEAVAWHRGSAQDLGALSENHASTVLIIPQQCVYLTQFDIPPNSARQVLSSIEYQIEDQLAQDVERQHVAIGNQSRNPIAIAVVEKAIMERCQELQQAHSLNVSMIIPEVFLCPWTSQAGEVSLIESDNGLVLRYGDYQGLKCRVEMLETVLKQITQEQEINNVVYYIQNKTSYETLQLTQYPSQHRILKMDQLKFNRSKSIDLQQRQFQQSSAWLGLLKTWRWLFALLALMLAVSGYNKALALQALETELAQIKTVQFELIKRYLPPNIDESSNLKKALITVLRQNQSSRQEIDFLGLLGTFTQAKAGFPAITVDKLGYQKGRLSIDVKTAQLSEIEALLEAIESTEQAVKLENLDIKPDTTSGRFVLTGSSTK